MQKYKQPNRILNNHQKRVNILKEIDRHLQKSGSISFSDFVAEFDIHHSMLHNLNKRGFLVAKLVESYKQNGKEYKLIGINWKNVEDVLLPDRLSGKRKTLKMIKQVTSTAPLTFKQLSEKVQKTISLLRLWEYEGLLIGELIDNKIMIFGIDHTLNI